MMTLQIPVTALLFVMMFHQPILATTELPTLSCAETAGTELVLLNEPCNVNGEKMDFACIEILPSNTLKHTTIIKNFTVTEEVETENSRTDITFCIAMTSLEKKNLMSVFSGKFLTLNMTFASNLSVGILVVNRNCWSFKELNCHHRVLLRSDVMSMPPMVYTPNSRFFWDFSLPLLQAGTEWVETLSVTGEGLAIDPRVLNGLSGSGLRELVVRGGNSTHSPEDGPQPRLDQLPRLRHLEITHFNVHHLLQGCFNNSLAIEHLLLSGNLQDIPDCVHRLKNLRTLLIESNFEDFRFTPTTLEGLLLLDNLTLSRSRIMDWHEQLPILPALRTLTISKCGLASVHSSPLVLPSLEHLDLSGNNIETIPESTLHQLLHLKVIVLNDNKLKTWPTLPKIHFLHVHMSNNLLNDIVNLGKQGITVDNLDLSKNVIEQWSDSNVFASLRRSLRNITRKPNSTVLVHWPWVPNVNLSLNRITAFSPKMLKSLDDLFKVDIGGNELDCLDCQTPDLQKWLTTTKTKVRLAGARGPVRCGAPPALRGFPVAAATPAEDGACAGWPQRLWLELGAPAVALVAAALLVAVAVTRFRPQLSYLARAAAVRSTLRHAARNGRRFAFDVFLCYSEHERDFAMRHLVKVLESAPDCYRVCLYERDFKAAATLSGDVLEAVSASRKVLIVLTRRFVDTQWAQFDSELSQYKEVDMDREFVVLLELEPLDRERAPRRLRFLLDTRPLVQWPAPSAAAAAAASPRATGEALAQLRAALGPSLHQRQRRQRRSGVAAVIPDESSPLLAPRENGSA